MKIFLSLAASLVFFVISFSVISCHVTPKQAGDGTRAACTLVEAFSDSKVVESVCAAAPDLVELAGLVMASRADAGTPEGGADAGGARSGAWASCKQIPSTTTCATNAETLAAIRAFKGKHP